MKPENETDRLEFSHGFDRGNYASAYETQNYEAAQAAINGSTGFYRIGHLLGFFSSYELHEVPGGWQDEVERYRAEFAAELRE
jgi:hypothetical protein